MADIVGGRSIRELRVIDLKKELEARSLPKNGTKKDLVERLRNYLAEQEKKAEIANATNVPDERGDSEKCEAKNNTHGVESPRVGQDDLGDGEVSRRRVRAQDDSSTTAHDDKLPITQDGSPPIKKQRTQSTSSSSSSETRDRSRSSSREQQHRSRSSSKERQHRSRSSSKEQQHRSRSSSREQQHRSRSSSREQMPSEKKAAAMRARSSSSSSASSGERSRSASREPSRSRSQSASPRRLQTQTKHRSRSQSESSGRSGLDESTTKSCDESTGHVSGPKLSALKADDSYHTASEDLSPNKVNQSFLVEKKIEEQTEDMEVENGIREDKADVKRDSEEAGQLKTGTTQEDNSVKTPNTSNKENEVKREKPARKRRWGSRRTSSKSTSSINISTDSLKSLIPDINTNVLKSESVLDLNIHAASDDLTEDDKPDTTQEDGQDDEERTDVKIKRTVLQEVKPKENEVDERHVEKKSDGEEQEAEKETAPVVARQVSKTPRSSMTGVFIDEPEAARRSPSPARNPVNKVIHLRNLVRPYTILQLQELLRRSGTLLEGGFWIDKVKSHCFVTYEMEEQATAARQALHGSRWPSSNPKILRVEYASEEELNFYRTGKVAGEPATAGGVKPDSHKEAAPVHRHDSEEGTRKVKLKEAAKVPAAATKKTEPVREWDRDKLRQSRERSREREASKRGDRRRLSPTSGRSRERARRDEKHDVSQDRRGKHDKKDRKDEDEVPAKLLDDLFRKTKATPCIYWLPLTDELIAKRATERKQREEEREKRRKLMDKEEEEGREKAREERLKMREHERGRETERSRDDERTRRDSRHRY